jgi:hypothetical protein
MFDGLVKMVADDVAKQFIINFYLAHVAAAFMGSF